MKRRSSPELLRSPGGFTLAELMIAISLTAVILVILLGAIRIGHRSVESGQAREEVSQRMRIISDRLTWLIRGAYPYTVEKDDELRVYFDGDSMSLGFVTTSTDPYSDGLEDSIGFKWIKIFADSDGLKMVEKIYFLEDVFDDFGGNEYLFDPTVRTLQFEYLDSDPEEGTEDWVSEWEPDGKDYIPSAVRMLVTIELDGKVYELPEITATIRTIQPDYIAK